MEKAWEALSGLRVDLSQAPALGPAGHRGSAQARHLPPLQSRAVLTSKGSELPGLLSSPAAFL